MRKPIQLIQGIRLIALCDDGTMWEFFDEIEGEEAWVSFPTIPQGEMAEEECSDENDDNSSYVKKLEEETDDLRDVILEIGKRTNGQSVILTDGLTDKVLKMKIKALEKKFERLLSMDSIERMKTEIAQILLKLRP